MCRGFEGTDVYIAAILYLLLRIPSACIHIILSLCMVNMYTDCNYIAMLI